MTVPLLLLAVAVAVGQLAGRPLARAEWATGAPRLAVALWLALSVAVVSSVVFAGVALALAALPPPVTGGFSNFLARCAMALRAEYASPGAVTPAVVVGAGLTLAVLTRWLHCWVVASRSTRRSRQAQRASLEVIGTRVADVAVVIPDDRPAVYCLPGRRRRDGRIVLSTGAIRRLTDDQLRMVVAHERAHLSQRHHGGVQFSTVLAAAFGFVPLYRHAAAEVPKLMEMAADDAALRHHGRRDQGLRRALARALVALATGTAAAPAGALAAAGTSTLARVTRLSQPQHRLGATRGSGVAALIGLGLIGPLLIATGPALCAAAMEVCPLVFTA